MRYTYALMCCCAALCLGADWPNFQGPDHNGISPETGLARKLPPPGKVLWTVKVGQGYAGPVVQGDDVFLLDREGDQRDVLRCFDFASGDERWSVLFDAPGRLPYDGSRSTPSVTDDFVYAVGPMGDVYAVDRKKRKEAWTLSMQDDYGSKPPRFGYGQSPLVYGKLLIVAPMSSDSGLVALDRLTGEEVWRCGNTGGNSYASPMLVTIDGVEQVTFLTSSQWAGVDPKTGKLLWRFSGYRQRNPISDPTPLGDGLFFVTGGYNAGSIFIKVNRDDDGAWTAQQTGGGIGVGAMIHPALLHAGHLYANINENGKMDRGLACLDLQGNIKWQTRNAPSVDRGNVLIADGMLISLGGQDGVLRLIELTPDGYKELASARMFKDLKPAAGGGGGRRRGRGRGGRGGGGGANLWAPMALSNGKLIIRSQRQMKCVDLSKS